MGHTTSLPVLALLPDIAATFLLFADLLQRQLLWLSVVKSVDLNIFFIKFF
jgi:predicted cobalt transporter CbtA